MAKGDFQNKYNELLSTHNYRGLAELLRNTSYDNDDARSEAFAMADRYEEEADIADKVLEGATSNQRDAYNFVANGPTKSLDPNTPTDSYSKQFSEAWNSMADENGNITIKFMNGKYLDYFVEGSGIDISDFERNGIKRGVNEISFKTDNINKINIYNGIDKIVSETQDDIITQKTWLGQYGIISDINDISLEAYNTPETIFSNEVAKGYKGMKNIITDANNKYKELMDKTQPYVLQTVVTGYMGEDDKQLQQAFAAGAMDLQTFKEARKILEEKYNRLLQTQSLSQYHVYAMNEDNEGSQLLQELTDNIQKSALNDEINLAMTEGRLHFSHASNGIDYGTMIVIDQKYDKKGKAMDEYPSRRFFVKDLFKSDAENSLRNDTQVDAQLQYCKHQTYGHVYRTKDGGKLENWNSAYDNAEYVDEFGTRRLVNKAEALNIMDDDIITKRIVDYYKKANTKNKNNNYYTEEYYQVYGSNTPTRELLETSIKKKALQVTAAKYGNPNSDYVKVKANKLASTIMKLVMQDTNIE